MRHHSETANTVGDVAFTCGKLTLGFCSRCKGRRTRTVSANSMAGDCSGCFLTQLEKKCCKAAKGMATNISKNRGRSLEIGANISSAAASGIAKVASSTKPNVTNFYQTGEGLNVDKSN